MLHATVHTRAILRLTVCKASSIRLRTTPDIRLVAERSGSLIAAGQIFVVILEAVARGKVLGLIVLVGSETLIAASRTTTPRAPRWAAATRLPATKSADVRQRAGDGKNSHAGFLEKEAIVERMTEEPCQNDHEKAELFSNASLIFGLIHMPKKAAKWPASSFFFALCGHATCVGQSKTK